jgi:hypothetical protein
MMGPARAAQTRRVVATPWEDGWNDITGKDDG